MLNKGRAFRVAFEDQAQIGIQAPKLKFSRHLFVLEASKSTGPRAAQELLRAVPVLDTCPHTILLRCRTGLTRNFAQPPCEEALCRPDFLCMYLNFCMCVSVGLYTCIHMYTHPQLHTPKYAHIHVSMRAQMCDICKYIVNAPHIGEGQLQSAWTA